MKREILLKWIDTALEQDLYTEVYIPVDSKEDAQKLKSEFKTELRILWEIDPDKASTIMVNYLRKDQRFWVVLKRTVGNALIGFIKHKDGEMERVELEDDEDRERRISAMKADGYTLEEVEQYEGPLSEKERSLWQ